MKNIWGPCSFVIAYPDYWVPSWEMVGEGGQRPCIKTAQCYTSIDTWLSWAPAKRPTKGLKGFRTFDGAAKFCETMNMF